MTDCWNDHLTKEEREVRRAEAIEARADELLKEGQEYYPLDLDAFGEVLGELSADQVSPLIYYLSATKKQKFAFIEANEIVCLLLWSYAENYWRKCAMSKAEEGIDNEN